MKTQLTLIATLMFMVFITAQTNSCACCTENHSEFDFWIGTWEVTNPNGSKAGENVIEKTQGNCMLQENWTSATPGFTGTSSNFYNSKTNQWEQLWIDSSGNALHLKGKKVGNQMILRTSDEKNAEGKNYYHQITWTDNEDGSVRQLWETITEGAQTVIAFDGLYKKVE
ncbi:MAG: hypothetical protein HKN40_09180 [Winogradskyella sp.]|uniref:hypothetical protein n=1 Tax=Winogradskyella sp. TaxID=1883156 RepID=UPI00184CD24C|nr:hypothetical protein [Winogradskyella sp.]